MRQDWADPHSRNSAAPCRVLALRAALGTRRVVKLASPLHQASICGGAQFCRRTPPHPSAVRRKPAPPKLRPKTLAGNCGITSDWVRFVYYVATPPNAQPSRVRLVCRRLRRSAVRPPAGIRRICKSCPCGSPALRFCPDGDRSGHGVPEPNLGRRHVRRRRLATCRSRVRRAILGSSQKDQI